MTLSISLRDSQENFLFLNHLKSCENHYTYTDTLLLSVDYHRPKYSTEAEALQCFPLNIYRKVGISLKHINDDLGQQIGEMKYHYFQN